MLPNDDTLLPTLSQLFEMADYATISVVRNFVRYINVLNSYYFLDINMRRTQMHRSGGTMLKTSTVDAEVY